MGKQHTIPTLLALLLVAIGTSLGIFLVQNKQTFQSSASPSQIPQQVRINNMSDKSFTVSWVTDKPTLGFVNYGTSGLENVASETVKTTSLHYVNVDNLNPNTTYYFKIGSGSGLFDNNNEPYKVKTAPALTNTPEPDIIFGSVKNPGQGVIVYLTISGITPLSAVTNELGQWSIPLSTARSTNLNSSAFYNREKTLVEIFVQGENSKFATVKVLTGSAHPIPQITLGQNQDFTNVKPIQDNKVPVAQITLPSEGTATPVKN